MIRLPPDECRVLGTLIEKAQTTPGQYPLTLNALVTGCNQKNNREPATNLDEDAVLRAVDGLKSKGLVREVFLAGSRVPKVSPRRPRSAGDFDGRTGDPGGTLAARAPVGG